MATASTSRRGTAASKKGDRKKVESVEWPVDDNGPMDQASFTVSELIPTGQYANVTVGPVTLTRFVPNDGNGVEHLNKLAADVETSLAEQRELVLANLQADVEKQSK